MFLKPTLPDYEIDAWRRLPFQERAAAVCRSWAEQGYGSPLGVYALYVVKIAGYIAGWAAFCTAGQALELADIGVWWSSDLAFQKAIVFTMLFEGLGFGCGSGPLTGRYVPPLGGALYFLRPGTTRLPTWPLPGLGPRRTLLEVFGYALALTLLVRALLAPEITTAHVWPIVLLIPLLGLLDRTLFLVFRSEHYLSVLICLLAGADFLAGSKVVWMAIWWWAATSKLNAHFPAVMCVMASNGPFVPRFVKRYMYRDFPTDLRPSSAATRLAHLGTAAEYAFPLVLMLSDGGPLTWATLLFATVFHLFILSMVPMGVPLEWNVIMVYGAFVLFGVHADVAISSIHSAWLIGWLVSFHLALPLYGSLFPSQVSFLLSMRYYAGNWASSVWLFRGASADKLDQHLVKSSAGVHAQLGVLYDRDTIDALLSKVIAFRLMHLHGRALRDLATRAVDDLDAYVWLDGELIAGMVIGWNFGEGHLHQHDLLSAVQAQCGFAPGELRVVTMESQPIHRATQAWTIVDACDGVLDRGEVRVADLAAQRI